MNLECIRKPSAQRGVLFVHGILSDGEACWTNLNGTYWPTLLDREESLKNLGIYVYTYQTNIFSGTYRIGDAVDDLKERMRLEGLFSCDRLDFVCHSMGGIVVRRLLVQRQLDFIEAKMVVGLFLVASPSLGSGYASLLTHVMRVFRNTQGEALRFSQTNTWLNDLDRDFFDLKESGRLQIIGKELVEDKFIILRRFHGNQLVPPYSGARNFSEPVKISMSDHCSIAKPSDPNALQHRLLCRFLSTKNEASSGVCPENPTDPEIRIPTTKPIDYDKTLGSLARGATLRFVGRRKELNLFRASVKAMLTPMGEGIFSRIFLLHGDGGMGKSTLATKMSELVDDPADRFVVINIDWEGHLDLVHRGTPDLMDHMALHIPEMFNDEKHAYFAFRDYARRLSSKVQRLQTEYEQGVEVLSEERNSPEPEDAGLASVEKFVQDSQVNRKQARARYERWLRARISPEEYDLYSELQRKTSEHFVQMVASVAAKRPIAFVFDTCEHIERYNSWLRDGLISYGSDRTLYILSGRNDHTDFFRGRFPDELLTEIKLRTFSRLDIEEYLAAAGALPVTSQIIDVVAGISRGVPLAVKAVTAAICENRDVNAIFGDIRSIPIESKESIIREITVRFLRYCMEGDFDDSATREIKRRDRMHIYTLALFRDHRIRKHRDLLLRVVWGESDDVLKNSDLDRILSALTRRYSFVFGGSADLHPTVKDYTLMALRRQSIPRGATDEINNTILAFAAMKIEGMRKTLAEPYSSDEFKNFKLDYLNHSLWIDEAASIRFLVDEYVFALDMDRDYGQELLDLFAPDVRECLSEEHRKVLWALENIATSAGDSFDQLKRAADIRRLLGAWLSREAKVRVLLMEADHWAKRGTTFLRKAESHLQEADLLCRKSNDMRRGRSTVWVKLAKAFSARGKYRTSEKLVQHALALDDCNVEGILLFGRLAFRKGDIAGAAEQYEKALESGTENPVVLHELQRIREILSKIDAAQQLPTGTELGSVAKVLTIAGNALANEGHLEAALTKYQRAASLGVFYPPADLKMGHILRQLGKYQEAQESFRRVLSSRDGAVLAMAYDGLAANARQEKRYSVSTELYQKALAHNRDYANARNGLGKVYLLLGDYKEAEASLRAAIDHKPSGFWIANNIGLTLVRQKRIAAAHEFFKTTVDLCNGILNTGKPRKFLCYFNLGIAFAGLGEPTEAMLALQQGLSFCKPYGLMTEIATDLKLLAESLEDQDVHRLASAFMRASKE